MNSIASSEITDKLNYQVESIVADCKSLQEKSAVIGLLLVVADRQSRASVQKEGDFIAKAFSKAMFKEFTENTFGVG